MNVDLTIKGSVESLHLEPDDRLVVTIEVPGHHLDMRAAERLREQLQSEFPDQRIIILSPGIRIAKATA